MRNKRTNQRKSASQKHIIKSNQIFIKRYSGSHKGVDKNDVVLRRLLEEAIFQLLEKHD